MTVESNYEPKYVPIGQAKSNHMSDEYYATWEKLRASEQRAYKKARKLVTDANQWAAWQRASTRLADHEKKLNTA